jgi:sugar/nucleoside kinase (ribokinase family)
MSGGGSVAVAAAMVDAAAAHVSCISKKNFDRLIMISFTRRTYTNTHTLTHRTP